MLQLANVPEQFVEITDKNGKVFQVDPISFIAHVEPVFDAKTGEFKVPLTDVFRRVRTAPGLENVDCTDQQTIRILVHIGNYVRDQFVPNLEGLPQQS